MASINILLKSNLSDILYQTSAAIIVSHIEKSTKIDCHDISLLDLVGEFKNRTYFKDYKSILIDYYDLETEKDYSNSTYLYIDSNFYNKKYYYIRLIKKIVNTINNVEIVIDSKEYYNIRKDLERIYNGHEKINIVENVDYKKLCVMAKCEKGGYYTGEELGWWGSFLNRNESIEITDEICLEKSIIHKSEVIDVSIVMAYFDNRKEQTINTLNRFEELYAGLYNFEVIIVDDNSLDENRLDNYIGRFLYPVEYRYISKEEKGNRINPCLAYNIGFKLARGKIVMIQNPECYHVQDILKHVLSNLTVTDYYSYSCFISNSTEMTNKLLSNLSLVHDENFLFQNQTVDNNCTLNWYNHPVERPVNYHFCSAIYKDQLDLLGGFDEDLKDGYCFDDDELLLSIQYILQLKVICIDPKNGFVIHQYHKKNISTNIESYDDTNIIKKKWLKNKKLFEDKKEYFKLNDFNYPRLLHLYWDGSPLSFLNFSTILSFNEYHKYWRIIIYMPIKKTEIITWLTDEQKEKYTGTCFLKELKNIKNVIINYVDFNKIGFDNDVSEVIKSDYFRYYILYKYGGVWSDFDILYTNSLSTKVNTKKDVCIFKCSSYLETGEKIVNKKTMYYPVALFLCKPQTEFFKYILKESKLNYSQENYQCLGASLFRKLFSVYGNLLHDNKNYNSTIEILDETYYLPWAWNLVNEFLDKKDNVLPENNIGIHWFNGSNRVKKYLNNIDHRQQNNFEINCYLDKYLLYYWNSYYGITIDR